MPAVWFLERAFIAAAKLSMSAKFCGSKREVRLTSKAPPLPPAWRVWILFVFRVLHECAPSLGLGTGRGP